MNMTVRSTADRLILALRAALLGKADRVTAQNVADKTRHGGSREA